MNKINGNQIEENTLNIIIEVSSFADLPKDGKEKTIYITKDNNHMYRWYNTTSSYTSLGSASGGGVGSGIIVYTAIPTQAKRAANHLIDLAGQIIPITEDYAALADNVYCGDSYNASATSFYKCDSLGNRSTSGEYMKLPDCRGLFIRGTEANSEHMITGSTPYDGKAIGEYIADAFQNFTGNFSSAASNQVGQTATGPFGVSASYNWNPSVAGGYNGILIINFNASRSARTANETRPASTSFTTCITY
jgi:hypothetical protein